MGGAAELIANTYEQLVTDCRKQDDHEQEAQEVDGAQAPEARTPTRQAGPEHVVDWRAMAEDYDVIRDHASRVISGAEDFNTRVRDKYGFVLPPILHGTSVRLRQTKVGRSLPPVDSNT